MQKHLVKLFISLLALAGIFYFSQDTQDPSSKEVLKPSTTEEIIGQTVSRKSVESSVQAVAKGNILAASESCLGEPLELGSIGEFDSFIKKKEFSDQAWNWDNYFLETPEGEKRTIHVVSDQNNNGVEVKALKVFREDPDGPTLLQEESFTSSADFDKALRKGLKMGVLTSKQTVDTLSSNKGLEIRRTTQDGVITELSLRSSKGVLDCRNSDTVLSCSCN